MSMSEPEPLPTLATGTAVGVVAEVAVAEELEPPPGPDTPRSAARHAPNQPLIKPRRMRTNVVSPTD